MSRCTLCPRSCGTDRRNAKGFCGESDRVRIARADLHPWEEPAICYGKGSGTVFFSGCTLKCCFCQNYEISQQGVGYEITVDELAEIILELQVKGACNINLVSGAHFVPQIIQALDMTKNKLKIPVVYNSGGYESIHTLKLLEGYIDIYLPDLKYFSSDLSKKYSGAENYFQIASAAIDEMLRQVGKPVIENKKMTRGVIIRHLVLPSHRDDSILLMNYLGNKYGNDTFYLSIMSQYTPVFHSSDFKEINRRLTTFEYNKVLDAAEAFGFPWFIQDRRSAAEEYIPPFKSEKNI